MHLGCEELTRSVNGRNIVDSVTFDAVPGEITVVMGPNGAGKTTLLRLLALLDRATSGTIRYGGRDVTGCPTEARRRSVLVFQNPVLLDRSVRENILYGARKRKLGVRKEQFETFTESLGIASFAGRSARVLSGGEKKRVMIAMALMCDPDIILLDEPFANLDLLSSRIIDDFLVGFKNRGEKTIVLATHDIAKARLFGDRILLIKEGRVISETNREELFSLPSQSLMSPGRNMVGVDVKDDPSGTVAILPNGSRISVMTHIRGEAMLLIPPTNITLSAMPFQSSARNVLRGKVVETLEEKGIAIVTIDVGFPVDAIITPESLRSLELSPCREVFLTFKASSLHIFKEQKK